jgi:hypothetical protein
MACGYDKHRSSTNIRGLSQGDHDRNWDQSAPERLIIVNSERSLTRR